MQKVLILEANEIPLRIFRQFAKLRPGSHIDQLMRSGQVIETLAQDVEPDFLYPSQTWASLNTGSPYSKHQIHWYNDSKPAEYPLFWKTIAENGFSVGVVNTLHSSPAEPFAASNSNFKFVIPDCFAPDSYTKPGYFGPFQSLNRKAVSANSRATSLSAPVREAALTVLNSPRYGIRMGTMMEGTSLVVKILQKKVNREQLRNLQFPLVADIFMRQLHKHEPDLAILFTNHVAASMHRYWYGLFPEDYPTKVYDEKWLAKYQGEINAAVDLFDNYVGTFMRVAKEMDRVLVIVSSMGQKANQTPEHRKDNSIDYRLEDVKKFISRVTKNGYAFRVDAAMVPQYSLAFRNVAEASSAAAEMQEIKPTLKNIILGLDQNRETVTISAALTPPATEFFIAGQSYSHKDLGFVQLEIDDHHSADLQQPYQPSCEALGELPGIRARDAETLWPATILLYDGADLYYLGLVSAGGIDGLQNVLIVWSRQTFRICRRRFRLQWLGFRELLSLLSKI